MKTRLRSIKERVIRFLLYVVQRIIHTDFGGLKPTLSYHDLHITAPGIKRTSLFNLPFNFTVRCTRVGGWELIDTRGAVHERDWRLLAGEYAPIDKWLVLDSAGHVIVDSRTKLRTDEDED